MEWLKRQAEVFGYSKIMYGLASNNIATREDLNLYLSGLFKSNLLTNYTNRPAEVEGMDGIKIVRPKEMSLSQGELKAFNIAVEDRYNQLPGKEPLNNPFAKQEFGSDKGA